MKNINIKIFYKQINKNSKILNKTNNSNINK